MTANKRTQSYLVAINSDQMGSGDKKLGQVLMKGFLYALTEQTNLPKTIILYNSAVLLINEGSEVLADLRALAAAGVKIYACGTCIDFYGIPPKLKVGTVTNMYRIVEMLSEAEKVIQP